jgi:hypothetical protein
MKSRYFLFFLFISFQALAQQTPVATAVPTTQKLLPPAVTSAFHKAYQSAQGVSWVKEDTIYKAKFTLSGKNMSVAFSLKGKVIATATQIFAKQLPPGVLTYLQQNDPGVKLTEISSLTDALGNIFYQVGANGKLFMFDSKGDFLKFVTE